LEVVHGASVTHTRQLDKIERTTEDLSKRLLVIELQNRLEHLDREWEKFREAVLDRDERGRLQDPSEISRVIMGALGIAAGVMSIIGSATNQSPMMAIFGIAIIGYSVYYIAKGDPKVQAYRDPRNRYFAARTKLLEQLDSERAKL
jgi:hypothetical protein